MIFLASCAGRVAQGGEQLLKLHRVLSLLPAAAMQVKAQEYPGFGERGLTSVPSGILLRNMANAMWFPSAAVGCELAAAACEAVP